MIKNGGQTVKGPVPGMPLKPADALQALNRVVDAYREYRIVAEQETTRRMEIAADRDKVLEQLRSQRELLMTYLNRSFDERKVNFERLFDLADQALERGEVQQLGQALGAIVQLAQISPFKALADVESARKALQDPRTSWDV